MKFVIIIFFILMQDVYASVDEVSLKISNLFSQQIKSLKDIELLKTSVLKYDNKAVPALVKVMKSDQYSDNHRWQATFLLVRIMGEKSLPFISKFADHSHWMMRLACLKAMLMLKQKDQVVIHRKLLKDQSFMVRMQALENIKSMTMKPLAADVWSMVFAKENYHEVKGKNKRSEIISNAIVALGDLGYLEAKKPLLVMIKKNNYNDLFPEINSSLEKLTGSKVPQGTREIQRKFWMSQI